jgi:microfibrillar-associated protein 1
LAKSRAKEQEEVAPEKTVLKEPLQKVLKPALKEPPTTRQARETSDDESEDSSSGSDEDTSSAGSSDDDDMPPPPVMAKPLFVPKHKRQTIVTAEEQEQKELLEKQLLQNKETKRKFESRKLVAAVVADSNMSVQEEEEEEEGGGATNPMPNDEDVGDENERDAWEVRELQRLLEDEDVALVLKEEQEEYERRKLLTDEERLQEDVAAGRYRQPGQEKQQGEYMQRFYHRGAFYMDEDQWDEDDVRHKAKEYARAATGEDKIDKRNLPAVMQVKKFGFARQNNKYKGLAKEDTTDKQMEILPIVKKQETQASREEW